jgi:signal transduction histidine kinase
VPCSALVSGVLTAVKPMMEAKNIHFVFDNSKAAWATIEADAVRVEEIFINLISNAVKFTPEGGDVLLAVECERETETELCDKLTVKDSGIGISPDFIPGYTSRSRRSARKLRPVSAAPGWACPS